MKIFFIILFELIILINISEIFNLAAFGAKVNDSSHQTALMNGDAFKKGIIVANSSLTDRTLVIEVDHVYTMLPPGLLSGLINVTIKLNGRINAWNGNESLWPNNGETLLSFAKTQGLVIKGNGIIDGFGHSWCVMCGSQAKTQGPI